MFWKKKLPTEGFIPPENSVRPVVLLSLDGWGIAPPSQGNAIDLAETPNMDSYGQIYPHGQVIAAGEAVGLPATEVGNSEVGHLTVGAGRVIWQSLKRIDAAIADGSFFENTAFYQVAEQVRRNNSKLHIMGLLSSGEVHSSYKHLEALLDFCARQKLTQVFIHAFMDGRDAAPKDGINMMQKLLGKMKSLGVGQVATVMGRYFAMDRDRRWERTEKAYKAMVMGEGIVAPDPVTAVKQAYDKGQTDEFIEPTVVTKATLDDNDGVVFFNFRIDRPRQLTMALTVPNFENLQNFKFGFDPYRVKYERKHGGLEVYSGKTFVRSKWSKNIYVVTMTEYQPGLPVSGIAFGPPKVEQTVAEVVAQKGWMQLRLAESEKERMVTYYFDGMREERYPQEEVVIVPSPKVATYDQKPEMSVFGVVEELKKALMANKYKLIMMNFANPDMVAHSGQMKAAIKACAFTDQAVGMVVEMVSACQGVVMITGDHGNAEDLLSYTQEKFFYTTEAGKVNTEHSNHPVPVVIISPELKGKNLELKSGTLADIAPTLLALLGLPKPSVMTGKNLLE